MAESSLSMTTTELWSISIKQVNESEHSSFTVQISPNDDIARLQTQIESVTGLKPSRQRLIYRGRLIAVPEPHGANEKADDHAEGEVPGSSCPSSHYDDADKIESTTTTSSLLRIKDITGLADGHTIHLIQKKESAADHDAASENTNRTSAEPASPIATGDFLAALLGLGDNEAHDDGEAASPATASSSRWRSPRLRSSRRRFHHRLEAEDLELPDPGSMESVRQGLLTLHTLLPSSEAATPLHVNRRWYMGQWIDCLDTVNQWLEATIIDVVDPDAILPPRQDNGDCQSTATPRMQFITTEARGQEAFVAASDLERRTQLLLEPCDGEDDPLDEGGALAGWKRRDNRGVQLLLIHYNGWPHRWDEWIRSDSDRIRPFRTRTRHPNASPFACPTPQSLYAESPSTHICSDEETQDREALLPELGRVMDQVNALLSRINNTARAPAPLGDAVPAETLPTNLPWTARARTSGQNHNSAEEEKEEEQQAMVKSESENFLGPGTLVGQSTEPKRDMNARDLEVMSSLMDRLGRTLIDAAPHVMSLAKSTCETDDDNDEPPTLEPVDEHPTSLGGLLSLLSRDRRRQSAVAEENVTATASDNTSAAHATSSTAEPVSDDVSIDPDHSDFSAGVVNTSRGEVRAGPRSRGQPSSSDDAAASLLGAYLASASLGLAGTSDGDGGLQGLGRLLSDRTGGIDIHIHAVVTGPGMPAGMLGLAGVANGGSGAASPAGVGSEAPGTPESTTGGTFLSRTRSGNRTNRPGSIRRRMSPVFQNDDEDEMGIFSALYSENPEPVDPISPANSTDQGEETPLDDGVVESPSPIPPHRTQSRRLRNQSNRSLNNGSRSNSASARDSQGRFFNRFFRRSNSEH